MREYLVEAVDIAGQSQHLIYLRLRPTGVVVEGRVGPSHKGIISQLVLWPQIEQAIINPIAIAIQMVENEIEAVEALQEQLYGGMAYQ